MAGQLPSQSRVVVIGGGVIGCSVLYHLAKLGVRDTILLERKELTCGTTWHSSAQVRQLRATNNLTSLIRHSVELYSSLEKETGQSTGWIKTGTLNLATTPDRMTHLKRQASLAKVFGVETHVIGPKDASAIWPLINTKDIIGATYSPNDGRVGANDLCQSLVKGAKQNGARVFENTEVTGFDISNGRVKAVHTAGGTVQCEAVAVCAGLWSSRVGALAGVSIPVYACEHFYILTKPIAGLGRHLPTLGDPDGYLYVRDEAGGLLVGSFEPNARAISLEMLPKDFAFDLLKEDWDHFEPMMVNALHRIPALNSAEVRTLLNGPECFTPDNAFLLGETPDLRGLFVACGMNSMGVASAGGVGWALADWIVEGQPSMDLWSVDIRRFARFQSNQKVLRERIPEIMGLHYAIGYPGREPTTARGLRRSPLHDRLLTKGAQFGARFGWERASWFKTDSDGEATTFRFGKPAWFDYVKREAVAARNDVVLFDQTSFGKLLVQGPSAEAALQRLCANNVAVAPQRIVYTAMLNSRGGFESDLTIFRLSNDRFLLVTSTSQPVRDADWIRRNISEDEQICLTDVTSSWAVLSVAGPRSRDLLSRLTSEDLSTATFKPYTFRQMDVGHAVVFAARLSYIGELGWELYVPTEMAAALYDELMEVGRDLKLRDGGTFAMAALRIEKGYLAWGHDITPDETPLEAGLDFAVKWKRNVPFIGRDVLFRQRERRTSKRVVYLKLKDADVFPFGHEPIVCDNRVVGQVTSAAYGYTIGTSVGIGFVRHNESANLDDVITNAQFEIEIACERYAVDVSLKPFFDPEGKRLRG